MYNSIARLAFEQDKNKRINIKYIEYNSLEKISGFLFFEDGLNYIKFSEHHQKNENNGNFSCMSHLKKLRDDWNAGLRPKCKETVKVQSIDGLIIGPYSATFKRYLDLHMKDNTIQS